MASTQVTCGRKRSLLRTFGSRRRHKDFIVSESAPSCGRFSWPIFCHMLIRIDVFTTPTRPVCEVEPAIIPNASPRRHLKHSDNDDRDPVNSNGQSRDGATESQNIRPGIVDIAPKRPQVRSPNCVAGVETPLLSPFEMHPVIFSPPEPLYQSSVRSVLKRTSLEAPYSSCSTQHNRRYTTNSAPLEKTAELLKLLDTSTANVEESSTEKDELAPRVQVRPALAMQEEIADQRSSLQALGGYVHKASAEEINDKLREMLAAIDALKPPTPQKTQAPRKIYRVASSRVFARMSDAFGRMYNKSTSPEVRTRDQENRTRLEETGMPIKRSLSQADSSQHSIRSIEIRLNEGSNLDRRKVQQLIGGPVFQKSVALNEKSTLCRKSDGQTNIPESAMPMGRRESKLRSFSSSMNPFEAEEDFENDLENGILRASPAGSSTPRICTNRDSSSSYGDDYVDDLSGSSVGQVNLARVVVKVGKNNVGTPKIRQVNLQSPANVKDCSPKPWQRSKRGRDMQYDDDFGIAKKHPSPSKRDLEELELAFQRYKLPGLHAEDATDELANSNASLGEVLTAKDPNKKMLRNQITQTKTTPVQQRPMSKTVPSRIPRPSSLVAKRKITGTRLAADCGPKNAVLGEPDELL